MSKDINVVVCIPSTGNWQSETSKSLALMVSYFGIHKISYSRKQTVSVLTTDGSMLSALREIMVKKSLQHNYTHILFVDSDMEFPMNALNHLLTVGRDKDFIGANCVTRKFPVVPTAHDLNGDVIDSNGKTGVQEVQHVGLAFALIKTTVIKQHLQPPLFLMDWIPPLQTYCGEDVYFCQKLAAAGVKMYIDHDLSLQIKHIGKYAYSFNDLLRQKANG